MRLPEAAHTRRPWRIHEVTSDFRVEDVWALPTPGGPHDLGRLVQQFAAGDTSTNPSRAARALFAFRTKLGALLSWDDVDDSGADQPSTLRARLPADLLARPGPEFDTLPFTSLYQLDDEWAAEIVNRTVHAVMHIGWVPDGSGGHRGQMAVLVKPKGLLGTAYMAAILPFRHLIVYPPLMREIEHDWQAGRRGHPELEVNQLVDDAKAAVSGRRLRSRSGAPRRAPAGR